MRYAIPILFFLIILFVLQTWLTPIGQGNPPQEAKVFLTDIQLGNLTKIVSHFGGNTCRCPARNGWGAFLAYQPGQETNLAFLVKHPFSLGRTETKKIISPP